MAFQHHKIYHKKFNSRGSQIVVTDQYKGQKTLENGNNFVGEFISENSPSELFQKCVNRNNGLKWY